MRIMNKQKTEYHIQKGYIFKFEITPVTITSTALENGHFKNKTAKQLYYVKVLSDTNNVLFIESFTNLQNAYRLIEKILFDFESIKIGEDE